MATTAQLEAAFEDAVTKLKNAQLDWITAKSDDSTDEEASVSESTEQGDIEDFTQNESFDQTVPGGQSSEHEIRPVWFVPNIYQLRPILGYSTNDLATAEVGYSTCSDHEKTADQLYSNTEADESQGTTTLRPIDIEGQYSPYYNMYYGSDGQVYGCAPKLKVKSGSTEQSGESIEDDGLISAEGEALPEAAAKTLSGQGECEAEEKKEAFEETDGEVPDEVYAEEDEEEEGEEYYVYENVEGQEEEDEEVETVEDIEDLAAYTEEEEEEYEGQNAEYSYTNENCVAEYEEYEDAGYSEGVEEEAAYAVCDDVADEVGAEEFYECDAEAEVGEVQEEAEVYVEYEGDVEEEEEAEAEEDEEGEGEYYDEACEEGYQGAYDEAEYNVEAVAETEQEQEEQEEIPKEVFYVKKDPSKERVFGKYLPTKSTPTTLGHTPVGAVKPGTSGHVSADVETSGEGKAYTFYKAGDEQEVEADQCAEYTNNYVDEYGNPYLYNPLYVPVNGYY